MTCETCGEKPKKCGNCNKDFTKAVIEIDNPETLVLLRKVVIPASMGTEEQVPPAIGKYHNVLLQYEANDHIYLYSSDGIPTVINANIPQEVLDNIDELEYDVVDLQKQIDNLKNSPDVADIVATYADLQTYDTSSLSDNDIIRVLEDETHDGNSTYYRWNSQTETWTYVGEIDLSSATFFYADPDETGDTRHIYKDGAFTEAATIQDVLDAEVKGQVILRKITNSSVPRRLRYEDSYLTRVNIADPTRPDPYCWLFFLGYDSYHDYLGHSLSDSSFTYTEHEFQGKLTAGSNITISSNTISATNTTYSNFVGTDGVDPGTAGLVPAPATTDAGKFLKADGTWAITGGEGIRTLTTADYDWPENDPDGIAMWKLEDGLYYNTSAKIYKNTSVGSVSLGYHWVVGTPAQKSIYYIGPSGQIAVTSVDPDDGTVIIANTLFLTRNNIVDSLTSTSAIAPLSAKQGNVLSNEIGVLSTLQTTAKTDIVAAINELATRIATLEGN